VREARPHVLTPDLEDRVDDLHVAATDERIAAHVVPAVHA
jgi:hypothetical protein